MELPPHGHQPVLPEEVLRLLDPSEGQIVVDCTIGRAGHALLIARRIGPAGTLIGIDADPKNLEFAQSQLLAALCKIRLFHANFAELPDVMSAVQLSGVHGILADLGLSTNQLFDSRYGL